MKALRQPTAHATVTRLVAALAAAALLLPVPHARAQTKPLSARDQRFILAAAQAGMADVTMSAMAARRGYRENVRLFGRMMVADHTAINNELNVLAARKGVALPDRLDAKYQAMVDSLGRTGSDFDNVYTVTMLQVLKAETRLWKAESARTRNADVKRFLDGHSSVIIEYSLRITLMQR